MVSLVAFFDKSQVFIIAVMGYDDIHKNNAVEVHFKNVISVFIVRRVT